MQNGTRSTFGSASISCLLLSLLILCHHSFIIRCQTWLDSVILRRCCQYCRLFIKSSYVFSYSTLYRAMIS